jgi:hypothetical protein
MSKIILTTAQASVQTISKLALAGLTSAEILSVKKNFSRTTVYPFRCDSSIAHKYYGQFDEYVASIVTPVELADLRATPIKTELSIRYHMEAHLGTDKFRELTTDSRIKLVGKATKVGFWYSIVKDTNHNELINKAKAKVSASLWDSFKTFSFGFEKPAEIRYIG